MMMKNDEVRVKMWGHVIKFGLQMIKQS